MKWTVAGAGALLCVAGVYALITGSSIIQVERGWATFIAGAVLLGAGVVVLGMSALMGRIDQLIAATTVAAVRRREPPAAAADAEAMNRLQHALHDVPPPPREVAVEALPTLESLMPQPVQEPPPAHKSPPPREPAPDARPSGLRDFEFVFPSAESAGQGAPLGGRVEPIQPIETTRTTTRTGLSWLRRNKAGEPVSRTMPAPPRPELSLEESIASASLSEQATVNTHPEPTSTPESVYAPEPDHVAEPEVTWSEVEAEIVSVAEAAPDAHPHAQVAFDPFSSDWLERALAGDEDREASRFTPPSARRAAALEQQIKDEAAEPDDEPAPDETAGQAPEPAPAGPLSEPPFETASDRPSPVEIGRYRANDVAYVMFSDGSITAETPAGGSYRFTSLVELRAFIERGGT